MSTRKSLQHMYTIMHQQPFIKIRHFTKGEPICLDDAGLTSNAEILLHHTEVCEVCSTLAVSIINIVQVSFLTAPGSLRLMFKQDHAASIV
jgi:hypothetical protein